MKLPTCLATLNSCDGWLYIYIYRRSFNSQWHLLPLLISYHDLTICVYMSYWSQLSMKNTRIRKNNNVNIEFRFICWPIYFNVYIFLSLDQQQSMKQSSSNKLNISVSDRAKWTQTKVNTYALIPELGLGVCHHPDKKLSESRSRLGAWVVIQRNSLSENEVMYSFRLVSLFNHI